VPNEACYEVKVENIFEGPMDLLVYLIRKNEVDVYDIPIAMIIVQYLEYLEWMKAMNIDFAGDFILMAAMLAQIKSKMLLPIHENEEGEAEDPRMELTRPILEYLHIKSLAEQLSLHTLLGEDIFPRNPSKEEFSDASPEDEFIKIDMFRLIDAFRTILEKLPGNQKLDFSTEKFSIRDKISHIADILEKQGSATFDELFPITADKGEMVVTFLAILEMAKLCLIRIAQQVQNGVIRLFYL
jgi:segregation and condensation protein A